MNRPNPLDTYKEFENQINAMSVEELFSREFLEKIYDIIHIGERERIKVLVKMAAAGKGFGRDMTAVLKAYDEEDLEFQREYNHKLHNTTAFSKILPSIDCGCWFADDKGVYRENSRGNPVFASKIPIQPVALLENVSTGVEKVQIEFYKHRKKTIVCDRKIIASNSKIVDLANEGIEVTTENAKDLVKYISDCITNNLDTLPHYKAYSSFGWDGDNFIPYAEDIVFDGQNENKQLFNAIKAEGDYDIWFKTISEVRNNLLVRLMFDAALASVLVEKLEALPFVFHLWGGTGTGKTVALMVAMSIWGNPKAGKLVRTMNMTTNAMTATAAFLNNIPFAGDELQTIKDKSGDYDSLIMRICEGIDRGRLESTGHQRETRSWRCAFLFTGEDPCTHEGSIGGVKNRVIEAEVSEPLFKSISGNEVVGVLEKNYGHAGKIFVDHIKKCEDLKARFKNICDELEKATDATEKQVVTMAMILLADELSCECIFKEDKPLEPSSVLPFMRSKKEVDVAERCYEWVNNFIVRNQNRFVENDNNKGEYWGKDLHDGCVYVDRDVLVNAARQAGFEFNAVLKSWKKKGYLIPEKGTNNATHKKSVYGRTGRYYLIKLMSEPPVEVSAEDYDDIDF